VTDRLDSLAQEAAQRQEEQATNESFSFATSVELDRIVALYPAAMEGDPASVDELERQLGKVMRRARLGDRGPVERERRAKTKRLRAMLRRSAVARRKRENAKQAEVAPAVPVEPQLVTTDKLPVPPAVPESNVIPITGRGLPPGPLPPASERAWLSEESRRGRGFGPWPTLW
jgi:hypothetical protein